MTLDEAIKHFKEEGIKMAIKKDTQSTGQFYIQLAKWLDELKDYRHSYAAPSKKSVFI